MQDFNRSEWLAAEHNRLHSVEQWPDGARKEAALTAIRSSLESLARHAHIVRPDFDCLLCRSRQNKKPELTVIGAHPQHRPNLDNLIALLPTGS